MRCGAGGSRKGKEEGRKGTSRRLVHLGLMLLGSYVVCWSSVVGVGKFVGS